MIGWVALARGFGLPACSVTTDNEFVSAIIRAFTERGPGLVEAVIG